MMGYQEHSELQAAIPQTKLQPCPSTECLGAFNNDEQARWLA